ncbi:hypothetical protein ONE63_009353 [Megalurothrips usitatus]|uniref:Nuclear respiratory factor 1 NLS/DNA-binding dimerisation domain-containing protein n=1 Tax=Megalurothrips usitatus TaxID=439358 RepID=A0AAV7XJD4_9NEOP|nr:hypothetical protein ONE63_009353 [Megalurothrips usitatus]
MVIYLPLLFADGQPTSLERITLGQLEKFLPFLLTCCPEWSSWAQVPPDWWPPHVPFRVPICSNSTHQERLTALKEIICRCYQFHNCEHVLRFCARLAELPPEVLKYKESSHIGFVSIFNKVNNKLIVTFKKKNQVYDKIVHSPFKKLLIRKPEAQPRENTHIEDIYLCNYCDEEFNSAKDAIAHEAACKGEEEVQSETIDQVHVMRLFGLVPKKIDSPATPVPNPKRHTSVRLTARSYMIIPFSSPLGLKMGSNVSPIKDHDKMEYVEKIEAHCSSTDTSNVVSSSRYRRPRQPFRLSRRKQQTEVWAHTYCFNKVQRSERIHTIKTGLNSRARELLNRCKPCSVYVERLPLLDPLAIHAAASLEVDFPKSRQEKGVEVSVGPAVCIDLTIESSDGEMMDDSSDSRTSPNIFLDSAPSLPDWKPFRALSAQLLQFV